MKPVTPGQVHAINYKTIVVDGEFDGKPVKKRKCVEADDTNWGFSVNINGIRCVFSGMYFTSAVTAKRVMRKVVDQLNEVLVNEKDFVARDIQSVPENKAQSG